MGRLEGRVAIVTGAGSGIGQGIAVRFGREGACVVVDYVGSDRGARQTVETITAEGGIATAFAADVTRMDEVQALVEETYTRYGSCDILVNNAGVELKSDFLDVTEADYNFVMDVNLKGAFFLTQALVRKLRAAGKPGRIVNISSVHEDMAFPGFATYCMSKGGLRMMMRDLAVELGPYGITINNIAPGAIKTPINSALMEDEAKVAHLLTNIPLGHIGAVSDVAGLATYLASEEAAYVTGSTFTIDGGLSRSYNEQ